MTSLHRASVVVLVAVSLVACGGRGRGGTDSGTPDGGLGRDGAVGPDGMVPVDGGHDATIPPHDSGPPVDLGPVVACVGLPGVTLSNVVAPLHPDAGVMHAGSRTLLSIPQALSPSLTGITSVAVTDTMLTVRTMPVTETAPLGGEVFAETWSPSLNRIVAVVFAQGPPRYEVVLGDVSGGSLTITPLHASDAPPSDGYLVGPLFPSGSSVVAMRNDSLYALSIDVAAATVTWGASMPFDTTNPPADATFDATHGRVIGYGAYTFTMGMTEIDAATFVRSPTSSWSPGPTVAGMVPPPLGGLAAWTGWIAYEPMTDRLFVVEYHMVTSPFGPTMLPGLWSISMASGAATQHVDMYYDGQGLYGAPYALDSTLPRTLEPRLGTITTRSLAAGSEGNVGALMQDGELPPDAPDSATKLADGRIVAVASGALHVLDASSASPHWATLGPATLPMSQARGAQLVEDPVGHRILALGGAPGSDLVPTSFDVTAISEDGMTATAVATTGTPPPRVRHSVAVIGSTLYVVGGLSMGFAGTTPALADVWALDLTTLAWRSVGTLATPRAGAALRVRPDGSLWVVGGYSDSAFTGVSDVVSLDPTSGASSPVAVTGPWPPGNGVFSAWTTLGDGILAIDLGGTIDTSGRQLWQLVVDGATSAHWSDGDACTTDYGFYEVVGVPDAGAEGWIVGASTWHAS